MGVPVSCTGWVEARGWMAGGVRVWCTGGVGGGGWVAAGVWGTGTGWEVEGCCAGGTSITTGVGTSGPMANSVSI